jgi:hypothetical protein
MAIRFLLCLFGIWLCWKGMTVRQVKILYSSFPPRKNYIRVLPIWSRVPMVMAGAVCMFSAAFGR